MRLSRFYSYTGALYRFRVYKRTSGWIARVYTKFDNHWNLVVYPAGGTVRLRTKRDMKEYLEYAYGEKF